jgi:hypothetical protein
MPLHRLLFNGEEILVPPKEGLCKPRRRRMRKLQTENKRPIRQIYLVTLNKTITRKFLLPFKNPKQQNNIRKKGKRKCLSRAIRVYA